MGRHRPIIAAFCLALIGSTGAQAAMSCSQRNAECLKFCDSNYKKSPGCTSQCADALPKCVETGCWVTRMSNKCGYAKS